MQQVLPLQASAAADIEAESSDDGKASTLKESLALLRSCESIPMDSHDHLADAVLSPLGIIRQPAQSGISEGAAAAMASGGGGLDHAT